MTALRQPVVVDQFGIGTLRPAPRSGVDLVREDADPDRQVDTLGGEERELALPIETSRRDRRVRQPVECDIVEDVVARAWIVLMDRLGYKRYVAQGGDWGNAVTEQMALLQPPGLIGIHTNMPATVPAEINAAALAGAPTPPGLSADEKHAYEQLAFFYKQGLGYAQEMMNRPQSIYGIGDSPVGMAAWMIDHDASSYALIARVFDGQPEGLTRDDILDNVTLYWLTNTAIPSARLYWESKLAFFAPKNVPIPAAVSAFAEELYQAPRSWTEKAYPKLIHYNRLPKGGHFAAWEQPEYLVSELRAGFKSLR